VLVALADHGLTPSAIAARLTLTGAPESLQGAVAAGLLGGGSRFLGTSEDCGRMLTDALASCEDAAPEDDAAYDALATRVVTEARAARRRLPGLGHPIHKAVDPRTPVIIALARDCGVYGPHLRLFEAVGRVHPAILGQTLPLNGAGTCGAALADLGFPVHTLRGFALLARTAGLLGHLAEEQQQPLGPAVYEHVDRSTVYGAD
jgi:citrate synthase